MTVSNVADGWVGSKPCFDPPIPAFFHLNRPFLNKSFIVKHFQERVVVNLLMPNPLKLALFIGSCWKGLSHV